MKWIALFSMIALIGCFDTSVGSPPEANSDKTTPVLRSDVASLASERNSGKRLGNFIPANRFEQWKAEAAVNFFRALAEKDYALASSYSTQPQLILDLEQEADLPLAISTKALDVIDVVDNGVTIRFLLADDTPRELTLFVQQQPQGFLVDWLKTLQGQ